MMGFEVLRAGSGDSRAYRRPEALLAQGRALAPHITAMMDVSDGLLLDASRMARASRVTLQIDGAAVPIAAPESRRGDALRWGDDYQLLFAAPAGATLPIAAHRIGTAILQDRTPVLLDGLPLSETDGLGYEHH
jgi:thiamine-monophosphate kinase